MSEHTKGLLRVGHSGAVVADHPVPEMSGSDAVEYYGGHLVAESVTAANARRLAACWNACDGFTTEELEAHTGPRLLRARLEGAFARIYELLSEWNRVDIDISSAILSGIVPDRHPLRSRLELLANHHKREQALADGMVAMAERCNLLTDLLREARTNVDQVRRWGRFDHDEGCGAEAALLLERIDAALAGKLPDHFPDAAKMVVTDHTEQSLAMVLEGWKLVPVEPTESMIGHGCGASVMVVSEVVMAWRAMLAAAPKHQGGESCATEPPLSSKA
ncbi:hypothetical protein KW556_08650 [Aeromonas veronii]|uniref:hypothetical protein n=1 Tax=Aeromonas veronii TaxID=654 RepID=UPI00217DE052|nr:hypothetical protein [Aeromonas veronii]UWH29726.1 hypothetical protein KW556_08650 [Aeromonas veronii]